MKQKVAEYMTRNVITLRPDNTVEEAIDIIEKTGHDGFPVVDENGKLVGYISSMDLLRKDLNAKIKDVMTRSLYVAREYMDLKDAARVMFRTGHSKLPVVDDEGRIKGIITNTDIIRSQIERADPTKVSKLKETIEKVHGTEVKVYNGEVEVDRLIPTQTKIYADELRGRIYELRRGLAEPVVVIKKGGKLFLVDGHHRAVAAKKIGMDRLDAYILEVPENVELGMEKLVRKKKIKSIRDIEIIEDVPHPLVEITFKNSK
ncbi:CBS domain-containing protein [Geoglobus acetivorans]|uniref:CBS domain-containing protein n=1 Tax=Geoglobus acetivorans TaxID=565033 RepID=A0ABZ3H1L0_GEOAI|nr:CBS domain-containing protein [Geoglobus acetivorans]